MPNKAIFFPFPFSLVLFSTMKLLPSQRRQEIKKLAAQDGILRISELAEKFTVSEMTIRRDVEQLEDSGWLERTSGGAVLSGQASFEANYLVRLETNTEAKTKIASYAATLINDGDTIALDASTTALALAKEVSNREITVVTHGLDAAQVLRTGKTKLILIGGSLRQVAGSFVGSPAIQMLNDIRVDHCFISAKGFMLTGDLLDSDLDEAEVKRAMMRSAAQVTVLADSSKFNIRALAKVANSSEIDLLISDSGLAPVDKAKLDNTKLNYHLVEL